MTTPPKAREYRISRAESPVSGSRQSKLGPVELQVLRGAARPDPANDEAALFAGGDDGLPDPREPEDLPAAIEAVKAEGLTVRQLRLASRIAAMNQIKADSDEEAVVRLRAAGIDPFHRSTLGEIVARQGAEAQKAPNANMPVAVPTEKFRLPAQSRVPGQPTDPAKPLPSREQLTEERRAAEIMGIQRDIARRRRRRLAMLWLRLALFVFLPTIAAGWYYFVKATPLYATQSQFLIQQADSGMSEAAGGLFSGSQLATNPDSVSVQSYLTSRDAMLRLDDELGFKRAFQGEVIDPILRLPDDASNEQAYKLYQDLVKIGYDPTEGVINMEVIAPDPQLSERFSLALISYAEGQVDRMTARLRDDQMQGAQANYEAAERRVAEAQIAVQDLQQRQGVLDPAAEGSVVMGQIAVLEQRLSEKRLELGQLLANASPNASRVGGVRGDIDRIQQMIIDTRAQLTESSATRASLAAIAGQLRIAEAELSTRQQLLAGAATQLESARIEANKQVRYLSLSVAPVQPDEATYPKAAQNTVVAFLIFAGIYLMLSLTASILREQVSS